MSLQKGFTRQFYVTYFTWEKHLLPTSSTTLHDNCQERLKDNQDIFDKPIQGYVKLFA